MIIKAFSSAVLLLLASGAAHAQTASHPAAGRWEVTTTSKAAFLNKDPVTEQRCLADADLTAFDKFFSTLPANDKGTQPSCQQSDIQIGTNSNSWKAQCETPRGRIEGVGASTFTSASYNGSQTFRTGATKVTISVLARRVGAC